MEDGAAQLQLFSQFRRIGDVAVVGQGHAALDVVDHNGLGVGPVVAAGGAVADVAHHHVALSQAAEDCGGEHLAHQTRVLIGPEQAVVSDDDAAALLSPVLQGEQAIVSLGGEILLLRGKDAEYAAFFTQASHYLPSPVRRRIIS